MNKELFEALDLLQKERGIPKDYMIEKIEAALMSAYKKENGGNSNARIKLDPLKQDVKLYKQLSVVEEVIDPQTEISLEDAHNKSKRYKLGDVYEIEIKTKSFGRMAAQAAKQVIVQGIREAEKGNMIRAYEDKKGEIVSAVVVRVDPTSGNATLEIGKDEMVLFKNDQIPGEQLAVGDRIKVLISEIKKETKGPSISLSRIQPDMVAKLFELEVPEIKDGTVEIKRISREAGSRTKIAVFSNDERVDAIGSCIGPKGMRKNNITAELCGEKLDIILYRENPEEFISAALAPATVESVTKISEGSEKPAFRVIVAEDQLSLAIGKEGQNARLAAKLTGCKIDIKSAASVINE